MLIFLGFSMIAFDRGIEEVPGMSGLTPATDRNRFRAV